MTDSKKIDTSKRSEKVSRKNVGPIYLGELNNQFVDSGDFEVTEHILLNENGSAKVIRRNEACKLHTPRNIYDNYMDELRRRMPSVKVSKPKFTAGHRFIPTHLMSFSASTLDGKKLDAREVRKFGSTEIEVLLPIVVKVRKDFVWLELPGYVLEGEFSELAQYMGKMWYLQWSHGPIGQTKLHIKVTVPNLKKGLSSVVFYDQFFVSQPYFQSGNVYRPVWRRVCEFVNVRFLRNTKTKNLNSSKLLVPDSIQENPKTKTYTYNWDRSLSAQDTMSIHVAYGLLRKKIFSPVGFVLSNIVVIALTILLTAPLTNLIDFIRKWLNQYF